MLLKVGRPAATLSNTLKANVKVGKYKGNNITLSKIPERGNPKVSKAPRLLTALKICVPNKTVNSKGAKKGSGVLRIKAMNGVSSNKGKPVANQWTTIFIHSNRDKGTGLRR